MGLVEVYRDWERATRIEGPLFLIAFALMVVAPFLAPTERMRRVALLLMLVTVVLMVTPVATLFYNARFAIPVFGPLMAGPRSEGGAWRAVSAARIPVPPRPLRCRTLADERVVMFLHHPLKLDSRVEREARTLVAAGYDVEVIALAAEGFPDREARDGYAIRRVPAEGLLARVLGRVDRAGVGRSPTGIPRTRPLQHARKWGRRAARAAASDPPVCSSGTTWTASSRGYARSAGPGRRFIYDSPSCLPDYASSGRPASRAARLDPLRVPPHPPRRPGHQRLLRAAGT